jgi:hypothetical protein
LIEIEKLIKAFEAGITRRGGVRCDAVMCAEVVELLKEFKELKNEEYKGVR